MNTKEQFNPPKEFMDGNKKYVYIETKMTNSKDQKLSEPCYWYQVNGNREPFSKGNIQALVTIA